MGGWEKELVRFHYKGDLGDVSRETLGKLQRVASFWLLGSVGRCVSRETYDGVVVPGMGRPIGTSGETSIKIIVRPGTNQVITAYPVK